MFKKINLSLIVLLGLTLCWPMAQTLQAQAALPLSLDAVIAQCKNGSLTMKRQAILEDIAQAEVNGAKEWWLPEVFLGTRIHNLDGSVLNSDGRIFSDVDRQSRWYGGEVNFNWNLGDGLYGVKAKKLAAEGMSLTNQYNTNRLVVDAVRLYYQLLVSEKEKGIYEELIVEKQAFLAELSEQVSAGLKLESELLLGQSNLQRLELQSLGATQTYLAASRQLLQVLANADQSEILTDQADLKLLNLVNLDQKEMSLEEHPLVVASHKQLEAKYKEAKYVDKSFHFPQAGLRYNYGPFGESYSDNQTTGGFQGYVGWSIPLGQVFYNGSGKVAHAKYALAELDIKEQTLMLTQEIVQGKAQLVRIQAVLNTTAQGGRFAQQALDQAKERRAAGIGSTYEVLLAQEEYIQSQIQYYRMVAAYNVLQYELFIAGGGDL